MANQFSVEIYPLSFRFCFGLLGLEQFENDGFGTVKTWGTFKPLIGAK